jgi:hypothetical protein
MIGVSGESRTQSTSREINRAREEEINPRRSRRALKAIGQRHDFVFREAQDRYKYRNLEQEIASENVHHPSRGVQGCRRGVTSMSNASERSEQRL